MGYVKKKRLLGVLTGTCTFGGPECGLSRDIWAGRQRWPFGLN